MNKFFIVCMLFVTIVFITGCVFQKPAKVESTDDNTANLNYILTKDIPTTAASGVKDGAEPGYVPINPNYDSNQIPEGEEKNDWFKSGLGLSLPPFKGGRLLEAINTGKEFLVYIANVSEDEFRVYFETLFANGFEGEINTWETLTLFRPDIAVNMRYSQEPGAVTTIRARLLGAGEYEQMKDKLDKSIAAKEAAAAKNNENNEAKDTSADKNQSEQNNKQQ